MAQSIISTNNYFLSSFLIAFIVRISVESDLILVTSPLQLVNRQNFHNHGNDKLYNHRVQKENQLYTFVFSGLTLDTGSGGCMQETRY